MKIKRKNKIESTINDLDIKCTMIDVQIYMPKDSKLRAEIIWLHHDMLVAEYGGRWKMIELVTRNYQWLGVMRDVGKYIDSYDMYQRMKNRTEVPVGKLKLIEIPEKL